MAELVRVWVAQTGLGTFALLTSPGSGWASRDLPHYAVNIMFWSPEKAMKYAKRQGWEVVDD
jgi:hypothetical protein